MKLKFVYWLVPLIALGLSSQSASAALMSTGCSSTPGAIADGNTPDACGAGDGGAGKEDETDSVNDLFGGLAYNYIGKVQHEDGVLSSEDEGVFMDFVLSGKDSGYEDYDFGFTVTSASLVGSVIDFVLFVKQGNQDDYAYEWIGLTLDVDGAFNSFNINDGADFSHISGFVRIAETTVPAPATLLLLAIGMLAASASLRRRHH